MGLNWIMSVFQLFSAVSTHGSICVVSAAIMASILFRISSLSVFTSCPVRYIVRTKSMPDPNPPRPSDLGLSSSVDEKAFELIIQELYATGKQLRAFTRRQQKAIASSALKEEDCASTTKAAKVS